MNIVSRILSVAFPFFVLLPFGAGLWLKKEPGSMDFAYFFYAYLAALLLAVYFAVRTTRDIALPLRALLSRIASYPVKQPNTRNVSPVTEVAAVVRSTDDFMERLKVQVTDLTIEKELLGALLNGLREGVLCMDTQGTIIFQNESVDTLLIETGAPGKPYFKVVRSPDLLEQMKEALSTGEQKRGEFSIGGKHFNTVCSPVLLQGKSELFIVIAYDDSQEHNARRMREDFLQNASHELKTPITSIRGYAETLLERTDDAQKASFLAAVLRNVQRMERLIEDMLIISKVESRNVPYQPARVDLETYMENLRMLVAGILEQKQQNLEIILQQKTIVADPLLLEHLLLNLIDNASRYSNASTKITVSVSRTGNNAAIEVTDEGPGIPSQIREKIFERFFRADQNRSRREGGSGLGLSIVRQIARIHGGNVTVQDGPQGGSVFRVLLPQTPD